jgi:hypothetical protein|nr:MAG TPA: Protein of unknown function (DUF2681) [Caudoviricetes sp.]
MFSRLYIVGGVVLLIVAFFSYKIYNLNSKLKDTVASYESKLVEANATIKSLNEALMVSNVKEATEKANRAELEKAIAEANNLVNDLQAKNSNLSKELEEWSKRADVKDVIDYDKLDSCEDLLKLNEKISRMKYEDL